MLEKIIAGLIVVILSTTTNYITRKLIISHLSKKVNQIEDSEEKEIAELQLEELPSISGIRFYEFARNLLKFTKESEHS